MVSASDLPVVDFVIPAVVWTFIGVYYLLQSVRRTKEKMVAGEVSADHLYYINYFFHVSFVFLLFLCVLMSQLLLV